MEIRRQQSSMQLTLRKFALIQSFKTDANSVFSPNQSVLNFCSTAYTVQQCLPDMELGHWVTGSTGHLGHLSRQGHRVIILTRCETRVIPVFEKNAQNAKHTFEMLKCWNDKKSLSSVCCWTEITGCQSMQWTLTFTSDYWKFLHISRHLEFIIDQGHRVNWDYGSRDSRFTGSLGHKMWPSSMSGVFAVAIPLTSPPSIVRYTNRPSGHRRMHTKHRTIVSGMNIQQGVMWIGCNPASKPSGKQAAGVYVGQAEFWPGDVQVVWFAIHFHKPNY